MFAIIFLGLNFLVTSNLAHAQNEQFSIIFGGDVSFSGIQRRMVENGKCSYNNSFDQIRSYLKQSDEVFVNLETPVGTKEQVESLPRFEGKNIHLVAEEECLSALQYAGITSVSLANNHIFDRNQEGIHSTVKLLEKYQIKYAGVTPVKQPLMFKRNGIKIAITAYLLPSVIGNIEPFKEGLTLQEYKPKQTVKDLQELRKTADAVIIYLHWDVEYAAIPEKIATFHDVLENVHKYVDVIIGSHAHVTQPHFYYKDVLVAPQMGNFLFPMHLTSFFVFDRNDMKNDPDLKAYEDWWYLYTKLFENPSAHALLYKLVFDENGLVPESSQYMETIIDVSERHCLYVRPKILKGDPWKTICSNDDYNCMGTTRCNHFECTLKDGKVIKYKNKLLNALRSNDLNRCRDKIEL
uniref:Capsule synthesis protein CapA domain-containing protein n=1 Tax=Clytia hemisphaerica TaxID=252671 RepID=A0A7M5UU17_9CNID